MMLTIMICTRNRADELRKTLKAFEKVAIPPGFEAELLIIDNGSTDATIEVVSASKLSGFELRYCYVAQKGKGHAINRALKEARGEIILSTDDDVRPPQDWVARMIEPILRGEADAIAGGIRLANYAKPPYITPAHWDWLASTEHIEPGADIALIGANMAFSRRVLEKVPLFDPELGPGGRGHADDTLFWLQLRKAGFKIQSLLEVVVEHHIDADRLVRASFVTQAKKRGEFNAYLRHHWHHWSPRHPYLRLALACGRLWLFRMIHFRDWLTAPTVPAWELPLLEALYSELFYLAEKPVPRNYEKEGYIKIQKHLPPNSKPSEDSGMGKGPYARGLEVRTE